MQDMEVSQAAQMEHQEVLRRTPFLHFFLLHSQFWKRDAFKSVPGKGDGKVHPSALYKAFLYKV